MMPYSIHSIQIIQKTATHLDISKAIKIPHRKLQFCVLVSSIGKNLTIAEANIVLVGCTPPYALQYEH